jgi:hypothetical protein
MDCTSKLECGWSRSLSRDASEAASRLRRRDAARGGDVAGSSHDSKTAFWCRVNLQSLLYYHLIIYF